MDAKVLKTLHSSEDIELYKKDLQDIEFIKYIEKKFIEIEPKNDYENGNDILNNKKSQFKKFFDEEKKFDEEKLKDPVLKSIHDKIKEFASPEKEEEINKNFSKLDKTLDRISKTNPGILGMIAPASILISSVMIFKDLIKNNDKEQTKDFLSKLSEIIKDPKNELGKLTKKTCDGASLIYQKMVKLGEIEQNKSLETFFKDPKIGLDYKINDNLNKLNMIEEVAKKSKLKEKDIDMPMRNKI